MMEMPYETSDGNAALVLKGTEVRRRIVFIDDNHDLCSSVSLEFGLQGYSIRCAPDGEAGLALIDEIKPDLIILDVNMPRKNGFDACKELRDRGISTPVILLTERSAASDKVLGLDLGADDYLGKPFEMSELLARVRALLRRLVSHEDVEIIRFSQVVVDFKAYRTERLGKSVDLSAREYRLLKYLASKKGIVVTRDELLDAVWGYNSYPTTRTVDNHIARLRQKIEENVDVPRHIITVHGVGYKFVP
jgi:DNA-binding response OmpR family regulator